MEWNAFKKCLQKEANYHCVEAKGSPFFQFIDDGAALKNEHKHQDLACNLQIVDFYVTMLSRHRSGKCCQENQKKLLN